MQFEEYIDRHTRVVNKITTLEYLNMCVGEEGLDLAKFPAHREILEKDTSCVFCYLCGKPIENCIDGFEDINHDVVHSHWSKYHQNEESQKSLKPERRHK